VARAAPYLPAQGPITAFVHHNPLHAFEDLPFEQAVEEAAVLYGCEPYLDEERYREELEHGRIRPRDLQAVLAEELGDRAAETVGGLVRRIDLQTSMLADPVRLASETELGWAIAAGDGMRTFRRRCPSLVREQMVADTRQWVMRDLRGDRAPEARLRGLSADVFSRWNEKRIEHWSRPVWEKVTLTLLWRLCQAGVHRLPAPPSAGARCVRPRDALRAVGGEDPDVLVNEVLIRFCALFADQGLAAWRLPSRHLGFYRSFLSLHGRRLPGEPRWRRGLPAMIARLETEGLTPEQSIERSLAAFGVSTDDSQAFVTQSLLALRGWAGMLWQLESRPDRVRRPAPPGTLLEFLAVRLILDRIAADYVGGETLGRGVSPAGLRHGAGTTPRGSPSGEPGLTPLQRAYIVFLLAQTHGWTPRRLSSLTREDWQELVHETTSFSGFTRRRLFHRAYERRHRQRVLDGLAAHRSPGPAAEAAAFQVVCCIDEREESFRRHLEEIDPGVRTFGTSGFFGVAMYYRGLGDADEVPLCPIAIRPRHRVREEAAPGEGDKLARRGYRLRRLGLAAYRIHSGSRGFVQGMLMTLAGSLAAFPLVAGTLFPRLASRLTRKTGDILAAPIRTDLALGRSPSDPEDADGMRMGFLPEEMADIVEGVLRDIGLTRGFAPLVVVLGHGSSSLNNPHEAAHDCGACGGGRGGPNARAFARMANDPGVRDLLAARGLPIPPRTRFLGAYHNTCDESVVTYDEDRVPSTHQAGLRRARNAIDIACERNAHERCRRFRSAHLLISPRGARTHVEGRAEDLAQPRPEFGHATNAYCIVGRRDRTRGLFLDRREFLVSYDPASEGESAGAPILNRILGAVVPVCAGINLEYYFSYVDPTGWGCGSKLPHNITSLLGVMDGYASDLRPGLPWQMVEIHEPVRLTVIVETTPDRLSAVIAGNREIARLSRNGWIQMAVLDPDSSRIRVLTGDGFREHEPETRDLPAAESSARWYGGLREHLDMAVISPASAGGKGNR
jgi:hypothetical protein